MAEKKMKQVDFWIRYFKEHINTIGCVELDGLDCREVLALLQELADKKVDKPNKMSEVARLFGKNLGEEFYVVLAGDTPKQKQLCKFTNDGLRVWNDINGWYWDSENVLHEMLTEQAVIVNERE
jgi:Cys-tRNA synthase (O-phospho-L-seryl-tRNA:Cys-tRNA synthase)